MPSKRRLATTPEASVIFFSSIVPTRVAQATGGGAEPASSNATEMPIVSASSTREPNHHRFRIAASYKKERRRVWNPAAFETSILDFLVTADFWPRSHTCSTDR